MPCRCAVCDHSHHQTIDQELQHGVDRTDIALRYQLTVSRLRRHAEKHLPQTKPFKRIREVAAELGEPQHVLRQWENDFEIKLLRVAGSRRYYRPEDVNLFRDIQKLIRVDGFTHRGVKRILSDKSHYTRFLKVA